MIDLSGRVVLVTGAAGNLGAAASATAARCGAVLALADRAMDRIHAAAPALAASSSNLAIADVDLTSPESTAALVARVVERFGRVDAAINTVGGFRGGAPLHETSRDDWDFLFKLNVLTAVNLGAALAPLMIRQGFGRIVHVGTKAALRGDANFAAYCACKAALLRVVEAQDGELKQYGVAVNAVLPGTMDTPQNRTAMPDADASRWVPLDDVAAVLVFLASDAARGLHGASVPVLGRGD